MALNKISLAYLTHFTELDLLFINNTSAVAANGAFAGRRTFYGNSLQTGYNYRDAANGTTLGFTSAKNGAKKTSSKSAGGITGKGESYAITKNNVELKEQMEQWTQAFLYKTNDPDYAGVIQNIYDTLFPFIASDPTGTPDYFTALQLTSMQNDKTAFTGKLNKFKAAKSDIDTAKKDFKIAFIPEMKEHITFMEGFLTDLEFAFPDFVSEFRAIVEKVNVIGRRHQGITATMKYAESGEVINSIGTFEILNYPPVATPKKGKTNTMGEIPLIKLKIGTWHGVFKCPGCVDQPVTLVIASKHIVNLNIRMVEER